MNNLLKYVTASLFAILLSVSLVDFPEIRFGFILGKELFVSWICWLLFTMFVLQQILTNRTLNVRLNIIDLLVVIYFSYLIVILITASDGFDFIKLSLTCSELILYFVGKSLLRHENLGTIILYSFCVIVLMQGIISLLQLYGLTPSKHPLFKMTGQFSNPALLAVFFAALIPFLIKSQGYFKTITKEKAMLTKFLLPASIILMFSVIPSTQSRASWIGLAAALIFVFWNDLISSLKANLIYSRFLRYSVTGIVLIAIASATWIAYRWKPDSVVGRFLVWQVSIDMIKDYPIHGVGPGNFSAYFSRYQALWFQNQPNDEQFEMLAGSGEYAFNEYIQILTEQGILGLSLFSILIYKAFAVVPRKNPEVANQEKSNLIKGAQGGLISILIFAFFSYPFSSIPVYILFVFYFSVISAAIGDTYHCFSFSKVYLKVVLITSSTLCSFWFIYQTILVYNASKSWQLATRYVTSEDYGTAVSLMTPIIPVLEMNGRFMSEYGQTLFLSGQYKESAVILERAAGLVSDLYVFTTLGKSYQALGQFGLAEKWYKFAGHFIPHKFYPKYLLFKLYIGTGEMEKACTIANEIMTMKVKVQSLAVDEMKKDITVNLRKISNSCLTGVN